MTRKLGTQNDEEADERPKRKWFLSQITVAYNSSKRLSASELLHVIDTAAVYRALLHNSGRKRTLSIYIVARQG